MKHSNYLLPNFINVICKKVEHNLRASSIDLARFKQYCLAVILFHLRHYRETIVGLPFSDQDEATLNRLCEKCRFRPIEGDDDRILIGLSTDLLGDAVLVSKVQLLVNYFSQYEVLKDYYDQSPSLIRDYDNACIKLETLRNEFRLPGRFKYNKFKRRDNPFFKGGVEVIIPEDDAPVTRQSDHTFEIREADITAENLSNDQPETPEAETPVPSHSNGQSETQIDEIL